MSPTFKSPPPGAVGTAQKTVAATDLATTLSLAPGDVFPAVFCTPAMVGLMEVAAARVLLPLLGPDEVSVGVAMDVSHDAPSPLGATITARAEFLELEPPFYVFEVVAMDEKGEIGRGVHQRAIVKTAQVLARAAAKP